MRKLCTESFIERSKEVHGSRYDYTKTNFVNSRTKLIITCPEHSDFEVMPFVHLKGFNCPSCSSHKKSTIDAFIEKAKKIHGDKYNYDKVDYKNNRTKVVISCALHGEFCQSPANHLAGKGCQLCGRKRASDFRKKSTEEFLLATRNKFGDKFTYDFSNFDGVNSHINITCPIHGEFKAYCVTHLYSTHGCYGCFLDACNSRSVQTREHRVDEYIKAANIVHNNAYIYAEEDYKNMKSRIRIFCPKPKHGWFTRYCENHLYDMAGCPICNVNFSKPQEQLAEFLQSLGVKTQLNFSMEDKKHIDIFCPDLNLGFEFDGVYWHSEKFVPTRYHLNKTLQAKKQGIRLVHVFEDEWKFKHSICENVIRGIVGMETLKFNARSLTVQEVSSNQVREFFNTYHLQGLSYNPQYSYGLFQDSTLIAAMSFSTSTVNTKEVELIRFASIGRVRGGFSKLLKHFLANEGQRFDSVVSFSDLRWSTGDVYRIHGFDYVHTTAPSHWWIRGITREHRRGYQHKHLAAKLDIYDPNLSEVENCHANGLYRIFDCGKTKWVLNLKS